MYSISHLLDQREVYRTQSMSGSKPKLGKSCQSQQGKWENSTTTLTFFVQGKAWNANGSTLHIKKTF